MNIIVKRILIGIGVLILILVAIMGGFYFKMKSEIKDMHVLETRQVTKDVYSIKDSFVNMFLVQDSDKYVAVDAGADVATIRKELKTLKIDSSKVVAVFLTHGDGDHTAALSMFKEAKIYLSKDEEQMINGKTAKMMFIHNSISRKDYTLLEDQQLLKVGNTTVKSIITPGHTPGSMSYLINDSLLFVGDAFGLNHGKVAKPNAFFSKDMNLAIKSFDKISSLPSVKYIFTAHTGFSSEYKNAVKTELK
ncbi:MAG: MBL fold metallo-hydrolase [Paludibacter sp.]|nr:MBL fold metallo-hydrolase [Paludibacter sp.]